MGGEDEGVRGKDSGDVAINISLTITITTAFMGFWGTGVEPGMQYTEKVSCTVWKMMMMMISQKFCQRQALLFLVRGRGVRTTD